MENFFIIDGNSLINRAFYALPLLSNKDGEYSNAVYGFCNILIKLITENKVDKILVAFDLKAKTFRHKMYDEYKANRKGMPQELVSQVPLLKELLKLMNIKCLELEGFEADDIIGTLSKNKNTKNYIITGDKDSLQLISENTEVWLTRKGISEIEKFDINHLNEVYGLIPKQIIDLKALMGDASDNIPGVNGIGEKTALKLLEEYDNVENLYNNIDKIKGKLQEKLINDKEMCFLSKTLATIKTDVPISLNFEEINLNFPFDNKVAEFFYKYQIKSLLNKPQLFKNLDVDLMAPKKVVKLIKIKNLNELNEMMEDIKNNQPFALNIDNDVHISNSKFQEYVIKIKSDLISSDGFFLDEVLINLKKILEDENIKKIFFDLKAIMHYLKTFDITLKGAIFDVQLADYLIKCGKKPTKNIQSLCEDENFEKEAQATCLINSYFSFTKKLEELDMLNLYNNIEFPLINVLFSMEEYGFKLDREILEKLNCDYNLEIKNIVEQIYDLAGEKFNINSPKQLGNILFDKLMLPNKSKGSTNIEVLEELEALHPIISLIIRYRKLFKLNNTYVESYLEKMDKKTSLVHTYFNQMLTSTGRLSSTEPNLQNIPIKDEDGRALRKIFISSFDDGMIVSADYNQIELRLLANFSKDEKMINSFNSGVDIHLKTASEIFNLPLEMVTPEIRRKAKAINFGIVYGISDYGLSQNIHSTKKEAKEYIDKYFQTYPGVKEYLNSSIEFAKNNGYVKTMFNRRRNIDELNSNNYNLKQFGERVALNMPLQGTASDIIKLAMIEVYKEIKKRNLKSKLILQIHDELIIDTPKDEYKIVEEILKEKMQNVVSFDVPLLVNISSGKSLYEAKD